MYIRNMPARTRRPPPPAGSRYDRQPGCDELTESRAQDLADLADARRLVRCPVCRGGLVEPGATRATDPSCELCGGRGQVDRSAVGGRR